MAIASPMNYIASLDYQKKNMWDFYFHDNLKVKFKIKTAPVLFEKLETKKLWTGENVYTGIERIGEFNIEVYETSNFATYAYFQTWFNLVYNKATGRFKSYPKVPASAVTTGTVPFIKTAMINFYTVSGFVEIPSKVFILQNVRIRGFEPLTLDYEDGSPLVWNVTLTADLNDPFGF